jgi:competence protein ComEC
MGVARESAAPRLSRPKVRPCAVDLSVSARIDRWIMRPINTRTVWRVLRAHVRAGTLGRLPFVVLLACGLVFFLCGAEMPRPLQIYFIDVEGGQSTLFVTPQGQSLLIDTGWPDNNNRDADRIVAAAKSAGISKLDFVLLTHYHADHTGGVPQLAAKMPIGAFIDHGPNREQSAGTKQIFDAYQSTLFSRNIKHIVAKPGDVLPINGLTATVVSADGVLLDKPLSGAGASNLACDIAEQLPDDPSENQHSLGTLLVYEKLRILDLGDLTWDKERQLMCPANKLGRVDIFVVSHHGSATSDGTPLVNGIAARVAIMDNGALKGANRNAWQRVRSAPGLEDLWQLHTAELPSFGARVHSFLFGSDAFVRNVPDSFIANLPGTDAGNYLKVVAWNDGNFDVYNSRTNATKHYPAR